MLSGCSDYHEVEDLTIVTAVAIDKGVENRIDICVEVVKIKDNLPDVSYIYASGETYSQAVTNAIKTTGNDLFFSHTAVMILSEEFARDGIMDILNTIYRSSKLRLDMNLIIAESVLASEILTSKPFIETVSGLEIKDVVEISSLQSEVPTVPVYEFIDMVTSEGVSGFLPKISLIGETREITGVALFSQDYLVGFLDEEYTKILSILLNEVKGGVITFDEIQSPISFNLESSKTLITPYIVDGKLRFVFDVKVKLNLAENSANYEDLELIETQINMALKNDINNLLKIAKENPTSDFLGLGELVYKKYTDEWSFLREKFEVFIEFLEYDINVNCEIVGAGLISSPLSPKN